MHAANWWDDIGFGHQDAYSNALAYHALLGMAELARRANQPEDAKLYAARAEKLRSVYFDTFYNPATGVLAGWKSADGKLHDYYFTFVNGVAITYGLIPRDKANPIMDRLLAKMKEVGYTHFEYGLPGNLIPIRRDDYLEARQEWGGGTESGWLRRIPDLRKRRRHRLLCLLHDPGLVPIGPAQGGRRDSVPHAAGRLKMADSRARRRMAAPTIGSPGTANRTATRACWWMGT